jgi:anti-sigma factor RsiW
VRDHPDREQLAAWQAGELSEPDRARTADHLAGCGACATVVADIEHARHGLALLVDPELPAGFHERLLAAVEREAPSPGRPVELARRRRGPWHQRPAIWAAAAALLLFVVGAVGLVNLVDRSGSDTTAAAPGSRQEESGGGGGADAQPPSAAAPSGRLPVVIMAGEFSPDRLPQAFAAYNGAGQGPLGSSGGTRAAPQAGTYGERTDGQVKVTPDQQACVDRAVAKAGGTALRPSFFVETLYQGKPARVLVATVPSVPNQARYFVFPGGDCSVPPVAQGLGSATPR